MHTQPFSLCDLKPGASAVIHSIHHVTAHYRRKLLSMGITPGTRITLKHVAPLGCPITLNVRDTQWVVRRQETEGILLIP